jgi:hypothetical protein
VTKRRWVSNTIIGVFLGQRKKRGRPAIGQAPVVSFRHEELDEWRSLEPGSPSRSEAIRLLITRGLDASYAARKQAEGKKSEGSK